MLYFIFYSTPTDEPCLSSFPWPDPGEKGGGAVLPVQYQISAPSWCKKDIVGFLKKAVSSHEDIQNTMHLSVSSTNKAIPCCPS